MRLWLAKLYEWDNKVQKIRVERLKNGYEEIDRVLYHQRLPFIPEVIQTKLISQHHNDFLAGYFGVNKTNDFVGRKYFWPSLQRDIEVYVKGYDISLGLKAVDTSSMATCSPCLYCLIDRKTFW